MQNIAHKASSRPLTTAPTRRSIKSSDCWQQLDRHTADINVKVVLSKNREVRIGGWTANQIHQAVLTTFHLSDKGYGLNQLRYDLRKLRGHGLIERDGSRYAYRLTPKGVQVALLFLFFHKRLCGPLANSRFHHQPDAKHRPHSQLEAAYHRADKAINQIVGLLAAA